MARNYSTSPNPFTRLKELLPRPVLFSGVVIDYGDGQATIQEVGGGITQAIGLAAIGDRVYFRGGAIEGPAPDLPLEIIEI